MAELLTVTINAEFDNVLDVAKDISKLQTYKLFEDDDMLLVERDDVVEVLKKNIKYVDAPTVSADEVRGVVHCKECKWCHAGYCEKHDDIIPWGCANKPWEDWFCADGKRREIIKEAQDAD